LLLLVPLGLALAALAGYQIARRALTPLSELARTIDLLSSSDMTSRVTLGQYDDEIRQLGSRFNALLDRLETAFAFQRRFMTDASHELRTPVAVALAAAQVATRPRERHLEDCEESLAVVEEQMLRLTRTIQDMFFLSQADSSALIIPQSPIFLDDAVAEAARAAKTLARAKQQTLRISALPEARCLGDQGLFKQAILSLLENAVKYTPTHGAISIHLERIGGLWICSITDNGIGISANSQARIFERFYRDNQPGSDKTAGSGLGLAIAKSIVEAHGGTLTLAESRPGFTRFQLSVPAVESEVHSPALQPNSSSVRI
jgi:signal transduction histidine kinase